MSNQKIFFKLSFILLTFTSVIFQSNFLAAAEVSLSKGQTVYVPVYSNVIAGPRKVPVHLSNTVIIRNTDIHNEIQILQADYYDTKGELIKKYFTQPVKLAPLQTEYLYLSDRDEKGGVGANFLIRWKAARDVNVPIIECVMVGGQVHAFVSPSQVIEEETK
ncbi:MAG: DUF3124 domain-containing protein [Syntrophotaleaceae bacterium]